MNSLDGKRIVITRAAHQAAELADLLRAEGALPLTYPAIQIALPSDIAALTALEAVKSGDYAWIIFTSANAVAAVRRHLPALPAGTRTAAVGTATAAALKTEYGVTADCIPAQFDTANLLDALLLTVGERVLLPQSEIAPPDLVRGLTQRGAAVTVVPAYRVIAEVGGVDLPALIAQQAVAAITFTSGSTVEHFLARYTNEGGALADLRDVPLACLGASAVSALAVAGLSAAIHAEQPTLTALVTRLKEYFDAE